MESRSTKSLRPDTPLPVQPDISKTQGKQRSPLTSELLIASRKGNTAEVKRLLAEGGGSLAQTVLDKHGRTCLHIASHYGKLDTVQAILNMDVVSIDTTSKRGFTPLHEASGEGHVRVVYLLLAMGAYLKARSSEGWTALMSASYNGHLEVSKVLIAAGLDVNTVNKYGYTALHVAAWRGNGALIEMLIKAGALVTAATASKKTPLDIAQEENHHEAVTILTATSARDSEQPFYRIAALESQLKATQEKLTQVQEKQSEAIRKEREEMAKAYEEMKQQLVRDLAMADAVDDNEIQQDEPLEQLMTNGNAEGRDKEIRRDTKHNHRIVVTKPAVANDIAQRRDVPLPSTLPIMVSPACAKKRYSNGKLSIKQQSNLLSETKVIDTLCLELSPQERDPVANGFNTQVRRSIGDIAASTQHLQPKPINEKLSITELVEHSLQSQAGTMAAIRKQLKEDNLTPKIKKKFDKKPALLTVKEVEHKSNGSLPVELGNHKPATNKEHL